MNKRIKVLPRKINKSIIPNTITGLAIWFGYLALLNIFRGYYQQAAWLILFATLFDFLDGHVARLFKATSDFGAQFDSLADIVNYGVAPALLYYFLFFDDWGLGGVVLSFLPVVCAAIRLARFNVQAIHTNRRTDVFEGLPTTMAALVLCGYVLFAGDISADFGPPEIGAVFVVMMAVLMVSKVPYEKENALSPLSIIKYQRFITASTIVLTLLLFPTIAVFAWGSVYVLSGLLGSVTRNAVRTTRFVKGRL